MSTQNSAAAMRQQLTDLLKSVSPDERRTIVRSLKLAPGSVSPEAWRDELVANAAGLRAKHGLFVGNETAGAVVADVAAPKYAATAVDAGREAWKDELVANAGRLRAKHGLTLEGETSSYVE